jgi:glycerophosphoryl diester phosphodiesterase
MTSEFLRMGHRGAAAYATENTLSSIQTAISCGVDMVEMDVRRTKDGVLVLAHGPFLKGQGHRLKVSRSTYAQLQQVCLAGGEVAPTLAEALQFINGQVRINLDLKVSGLETDTVALIKKLGLENKVMFSASNPHFLKKVKRINPSLYVTLSFPSSFLIRFYYIRPFQPLLHYLATRHIAMSPVHFVMRQLLPFTLKRLATSHIDAVIIRAPFISSKLVDVAHRKECKLYAFPVDAAADVAKLRSLGVDGIGSNRPDLLQTPAAELAHQ